MKRVIYASESELAAVVVAWLQEHGWDVYQEVQICQGLPIADIVAKMGPRLWVVECKRSLSIEVIGQADYWRRFAHQVSVAVPPARDSAGRGYARGMLRRDGIGMLEVGSGVGERLEPRLRRRIDERLRNTLADEHRTYAPAGNADGKRWTPWQGTCQRVSRAVKEQPGMTLKELLANIETHYSSPSSARSSLAHWIGAGKIDGVRLERDGRVFRLYPSLPRRGRR